MTTVISNFHFEGGTILDS